LFHLYKVDKKKFKKKNKITIYQKMIQNVKNIIYNKTLERKDAHKFLFNDTVWSIDTSFLSYVTPYYVSTQVLEYSKKIYTISEKHYIWDMFGGIGMDGIIFSQHYNVIISEINPSTYVHLLENIKTHYNKNKKLLTYNTDNCELIDKLSETVDLVYFDPPWGTEYNSNSYFDFKTVTLENQTSVMTLFNKIYTNITKNIIIKCPYKCYTFENLFKLKTSEIIYFPQYKLKFIFITINTKHKQT